VEISAEPTDDEIYAFVERWAELLAAEDFDAAYSMTHHDPYYGWSPGLIRKTIEGYGLPEPHPRGPFRVTPVGSASGKMRRAIYREEGVPPSAFAWVSYDLPLNGEWSDLTATFRLEKHKEKAIVILEEIHVF